MCGYVSLFSFLLGSYFFLVFLCVSVCAADTFACVYLVVTELSTDLQLEYHSNICRSGIWECKADHCSAVYVQLCCVPLPAVCAFMWCWSQGCGGTSRGAVINSLGLPCRGALGLGLNPVLPDGHNTSPHHIQAPAPLGLLLPCPLSLWKLSDLNPR